MLKALAHTDDGPLLVFGLSAMNIIRLQEGLPIKINLAELGLKGSMMIFAGDTEASMEQELRAAGVMPPARSS